MIIDGITVWEQQAHYSCDGWDQGPTDFPGYYISNGWICYLDVSVGVPCSGTMAVKFTSDVNQIITNEGWAFSDFSVTDTSDSGRWNGGELEILNLVDNEPCGKLAQIVGQLFFPFKNAVGVCSVRE